MDQGSVRFRAKKTTGDELTVTLRAISRCLLAAFFLAAGANHFRMSDAYLGMMPSWLPRPLALVYLSGLAEMLGGIGVLFPSTSRLAGWGLVILLIAIFPANLHVALQGRMPGFDFSPLTLWLRLPFQAILFGWVWWTTLLPQRNETLD